MNVAITGHTSGLGLAFFNYFKDKDYRVIGFSRSNGFDISKKDHRSRILEELDHVDIFVNNAYCTADNSQLELLKSAFDLWKGTGKLIINVSSRYTSGLNSYCLAKKEQDIFCQSNEYKLPRILNLKPGLIDTPRVKYETGKKMTTDEVISLTDKIINLNVHSITFGHTNK